MLTKKPLKLEFLKVESFMTTLNDEAQNLIRGGSEPIICNAPQVNTLVPIYC